MVFLLDLGSSQEIATVSVGIRGHVLLFDTWHLLHGRRLGVQRSSIYAILAAMMTSSVFHKTTSLVAEFCVLRVAVSNFESHGH